MPSIKSRTLVLILLAIFLSLQVLLNNGPNYGPGVLLPNESDNNDTKVPYRLPFAAGPFSSILMGKLRNQVDLNTIADDTAPSLEYTIDQDGRTRALAKRYSKDETCRPKLVGLFVPPNITDYRQFNTLPGGEWRPRDCAPAASVAIILPFRGRQDHLPIFLPYIHSFLQNQQLHYRIFVVEQADDSLKFNRAKLLNIGYTEASKNYSYDCYIFHDVDLLPLDERNLYICSNKGPRHFAVGINKFGYQMPAPRYFGGVSSFTHYQFQKINGFSNKYFGWGCEDDDSERRVNLTGQEIQRYPLPISRYDMFKHSRDKGNEENPDGAKLVEQTNTTWKTDGLNTLTYKIKLIEETLLYTNVTVHL